MLSVIDISSRMGVALGLIAGCYACAADHVKVGEQGAQANALAAKSLECIPGDSAYEPAVEWEGYIENSVVEYATERVRIREPHPGEAGFVIFGSGPIPPEPTDPNAGWPCPDMGGAYVIPGYPYTMQQPLVSDFRMRFRISAYEPMGPWCALHAPSQRSPGRPGDGCETPTYQTDGMGSMWQSAASSLCYFCGCDQTSCYALASDDPKFTMTDGIYYVFDIGVDGNRADGTVKNLLPDISAAIGNYTEHARFQRVTGP